MAEGIETGPCPFPAARHDGHKFIDEVCKRRPVTLDFPLKDSPFLQLSGHGKESALVPCRRFEKSNAPDNEYEQNGRGQHEPGSTARLALLWCQILHERSRH